MIQDSFALQAEMLEHIRKPLAPVGDDLIFLLKYAAVFHPYRSEYVEKRPLRSGVAA